MKKILVIAPHPDDETLGCGGTILRYVEQGDEVYWLIVTNIFEKNGWPAARVSERQKEIKAVSKSYGFNGVYEYNFPAAGIDQYPFHELVTLFGQTMDNVKPQIVYLPNRSDIHTDHQIVFKAAVSCTKNFRYPFIEKILIYETISETDFIPPFPEGVFAPNIFVDITKHMNRKLEIMGMYASEVMCSPMPRSLEAIKALAHLRGSQMGRHYAEAFMLIKEMI